jgi:hypothetical protein
LTTFAEAEVVPSSYLVVDAFLTVTFWPAEVVSVKLDLETLETVPDDPPAAGPERALDPPPRAAGRADGDEADVAPAVVAAPEPVLAVALTMP